MLRYIICLCLAGLMTTPAQALPKEQAEKQCRYQWMDEATWTQREEIRTARCITSRFPVSGGFSKLDQILSCESGWNRHAYNPAGPYVGLGQVRDWSSRFQTFKVKAWNLSPNWRNSRSMLTILIRWAHASGWSAWSCA